MSFKPLQRMSSSARSAPRSLSNFLAVLVVVESVFAVCVELSPTALWTPLGSKIQVLCAQCNLDHRIKSGRFARPHAGDIANRRYSRHSVTFDRSEQINARARVCEAQSGTEGGGRTARRTRSMICIRSEAMPRTSDRRSPELQCSRPPGTSWVLARSSVCGSVPRVARSSGIRGTSTKLKQPSETTGIKHLRCRLCCARRFATSQAFAPAYRRKTASVSSATWAVLGCRVAPSPSDEERSLCPWISALRLLSSALPSVTVVAGCSMAGRRFARNAHFLLQMQGKLPGGARWGMRHRACAA